MFKRNLFKFFAGSLICIILFFIPERMKAEGDGQQQTVQGIVSDLAGKPVTGANVVVKGTNVGAITDESGKFSIQVASSSSILVFSFIGMKSVEVPVNNKTNIDVTLSEDIIGLDELIVVGYMTQKKADLTGAVAVVSNTEIQKTTNANVLKSLQGKIPGMFVTSDGNPNDNVNIMIRGITSVRANPPLIVIDGLPSTANLKDINQQDIESIQVLKDAASASIYGSRAASGVILITTKNGKVGDQKITYDGSVGISALMKRLHMMNTEQYGTALWQASINDGLDPSLNTKLYTYDWHKDANGVAILDKVNPVEWLNAAQTMHSANTDWIKAATQLGIQQNHQLSIMNGTEKAKTMLSLNYYENKGTQIYTYFKRYSLRFNSEYSLIKNILTVGENFIASKENIVDQNQMDYMIKLPAILPVHTTDGVGWGGSAMSLGMDDYNNPVRILTQGKDDVDHYVKLLGSGFANLKILKGLNFKTQYGIDYSSRYYRTLTHPYIEAGGKQSTITAVNGLASRSFTWTWTNTLNYNLSIGEHQLDVLAGMEALRYTTESLSGNRQDVLLQDYNYAFINSATGTQTIAGSGDEFSLLSYFSKFNYVFASKYLLSATLRYDGSSKFGQNNRFGFFPAVSAGWRISEETFLKNIEVISNLKLRASWGMNGNSNIPTNALVNYYDANYAATAYGLRGNESGTLLSGYRRIHMGNPNLKWEGTKQTDIGFDFGLWDNRLSGSVDYYHKFTDGMLYEPGYLSAIGEGGAMWINAANMTNKGIEFQVTYQSDPGKAFTYSITGNVGSYTNTIDDLPTVVKFDYGGNGLGDDILGRPLNSIYGFVADGIFQTQEEVNNSPEQPGKGVGRIRYKDLDHDGRITTQYDRTWIGVTDPDFSFGISYDANFKNFDFSMFWQGLWGNTVRNDWKTYSDFWNVWTQNGFNHTTRLLGAWSTTNTGSTIPALSMSNANNERQISTYFMESGSYLKLRSIEIGYSLPKSIASKLSVQRLRYYIQAQNIINLHKWWGDNKYTGIDPENPTKAGEYSSPYVVPQFFKTGISVTF